MSENATPRLRAAGLSDSGRKRELNEDSFAVDPAAGLLLVSDGMGGHEAGEVASAEVVRRLAEALAGVPETAEAAAERVAESVRRVNRRVRELGAEAGGARMGATLVGLQCCADGRAVVFHVGDSRLYRLRGGELERLTRDHGLYQEWLDGGQVGEAPSRSALSRAIGPAEEAEAEVSLHRLAAGDLFLLCSDGLTGMVPDAILGEVLKGAEAEALERVCRQLVEMANDRGGKDNVTVVVGQWG